jgi:hypothetical protein
MGRYFTEHQIIPLFSVMFYFSLLVEWMISVYMITAVACVVLIFYFFQRLSHKYTVSWNGILFVMEST